MKTRTFILSTFSALLLFSSCQSSPAKGKDAKGIWGFQTLKGDYAELWMDEDALVTVKNPNPNPAFFSYMQNGDTIKLYNYGEADADKPPLDKFVITSRADKKMGILQDGHTNELTLISTDVPAIENSQEYKDNVLGQLKSRTFEKTN